MQRTKDAVLMVIVLAMVVHGARIKRQSQVRARLDLALIVDVSSDVGQDGLQRTMSFLVDFLNSYEIGPDAMRVALVSYSADSQTQLGLSTNRDDVTRAIYDLRTGGPETNTAGALQRTRNDIYSQRDLNTLRLAVVVTNGGPNQDEAEVLSRAGELRSNGAYMMAISLTNEPDGSWFANQPSEMFVHHAVSYNLLYLLRPDVSDVISYLTQPCSGQYDVTFAVDASGSVGDVRFRQVLSTIQSTAYTMNIGASQSHVAVVTFSGAATEEFRLNQYSTTNEVVEAVGRIRYQPGSTNTADVIRMANDVIFQTANGDRSDRKNILVIFTDGDSDNKEQTVLQAIRAKQAGITILVVAVGNWVDVMEIENIASYPQNVTVLNVPSVSDASPVRNFLRQFYCTSGSRCNNSPCRNGGICVDEVSRFQCQCIPTWGGVQCEQRIESANAAIDLAIAIDASLDRQSFRYVLSFVRQFLSNLNIGPSAARVALVTFSEQATVRFYLDSYQGTQEVLNAISFDVMPAGTSYAAALDAINDQIFQSGRGDRSNAPNIVLLISDGYSSDQQSTLPAVSRYRSRGNALVVVGVNPDNVGKMRELQILASDPDFINLVTTGSYLNLASGNGDIIGQLFRIIFQGQDACSSSPCINGGTCVRGLNSYQCQCLTGYTGPSCERQCDGKLDIAFLLDSSGSIRHEKYPEVLQFVANITDQLEVRPGRTNVGVIVYSDSAYLDIKLNEYTNKEDLLWAIKLLPYRPGRTNTASAIELLSSQFYTSENGDRFDGPNIVVLISDGHDTVNAQDTLPQAITARENGIHFMVVTLENMQVDLEVKGIASDPDEFNIFTAPRFANLPGLVQSIVQATCVERSVCNDSPCLNGGTCLPQLGTYYCLCPDRYTGFSCQRRCTTQKDVIFVLDASGSVTSRFELEQDLTKRIVAGLNFAGSRVRVGMVTYQNTATIQFNLNKYTLKDSVLNAVAFTNRMALAGTNTAEAIQRMRLDMFRSNDGDRNGVDNVAVVMSDGKSNINPHNTVPEADMARRAGIRMLSVGIGLNVDKLEIDGIANQPATDNAFYLTSAANMEAVANAILDQLCV